MRYTILDAASAAAPDSDGSTAAYAVSGGGD